MPEVQKSPAVPSEYQGIPGEVLLRYLERIERLEEEKTALCEDIKEVFQEAKGNGFDVKIMKELLKIRKMEEHELDEKETMIDVYRKAIGMVH
ncbi:MAG: DUF2312 domain-containing protein [Magnetococcales bacterium]|nr:DUF2312 domain-containing protein [Magnetococcales bacterium]MBF0151543.1 DUF2312 domain-containing protein [Magnetococcales bacterium]